MSSLRTGSPFGFRVLFSMWVLFSAPASRCMRTSWDEWQGGGGGGGGSPLFKWSVRGPTLFTIFTNDLPAADRTKARILIAIRMTNQTKSQVLPLADRTTEARSNLNHKEKHQLWNIKLKIPKGKRKTHSVYGLKVYVNKPKNLNWAIVWTNGNWSYTEPPNREPNQAQILS